MIERYELKPYESGAGAMDASATGNYVFFVDLQQAATHIHNLIEAQYEDCECGYWGEGGTHRTCERCHRVAKAGHWLDEFNTSFPEAKLASR